MFFNLAFLSDRTMLPRKDLNGISLSSLKTACRKLGIFRWPYSRGRRTQQENETEVNEVDLDEQAQEYDVFSHINEAAGSESSAVLASSAALLDESDYDLSGISLENHTDSPPMSGKRTHGSSDDAESLHTAIAQANKRQGCGSDDEPQSSEVHLACTTAEGWETGGKAENLEENHEEERDCEQGIDQDWLDWFLACEENDYSVDRGSKSP
eukprot:764633-Hanusia_phi.AAC.1